MRNPIIALAFTLGLLVLWGCERPLIDPSPPTIELLSPDPNEVLTDPKVTVALRATSFRAIQEVALRGLPMAFDSENAQWTATLILAEGLNRLPLTATDVDDVTQVDTLDLVYFPYQFSSSALALPEARGGHTATLLQDRRILITGGSAAQDVPASPDLFLVSRVDPTISTIDQTLNRARTGHTASLLPDGRVLIVGGTRVHAAPDLGGLDITHLVEDVEMVDPITLTSTLIPFDGDPVRRAQHTAMLFPHQDADGTTAILYLYGGIGDIRYRPEPRLGIRRDMRVFRFRNDSLIAGGPTFGIFLETVSGHSQTLLEGIEPNGDARFLVAGTDFAGVDQFQSVFFELDFSAAQGLFQTPVAHFIEPRTDHAAGRVTNPSAVMAFGGRQFTQGTALESTELYLAPLNRFFLLPEQRAMLEKRWSHTATNWDDRRILLVGGFSPNGRALRSAEWFEAVPNTEGPMR